jgi:hypothetical protein
MVSSSAVAGGLTIGPITVDVPVVLAPMAGITNTAFRRLCREYGAGLYVSEMITSRALVERTPASMRLIRHHESETTRSIQLYGVDPKTIGEAARMLGARGLPITSTSTSDARYPRSLARVEEPLFRGRPISSRTSSSLR